MSKVSIEYYGMDGMGRTLTEAKKDAGMKIEQAMKGSYEPKVIASRGYVILVWRDPYGWRSSYITDGGDDKGGNDGFREQLSYSSGHVFKEAYQSALMSLAQATWDGQEQLPPCLGDASSLLKRRDVDGKSMLSEFAHWRGFQLAYRAARANGIEDHACHQWACEHTAEFAA